MMRLLLLFLIINSSSVYAFLGDQREALNAYKSGDLPHARTLLESWQVNDPDNPFINYNMGCVCYQQQDYKSAARNFARTAHLTAGNNIMLADKARFNEGNAYFKDALATLGNDWESSQIPDESLQQAIDLTKQAIAIFSSITKSTTVGESAHKNEKVAQELLEKLLKKQKQQQDQKKDEKEQNQEENKEKNDNDKKNNQQQEHNNKEQKKQESPEKNNDKDNDSQQKQSQQNQSQQQKQQQNVESQQSGEQKQQHEKQDDQTEGSKDKGTEPQSQHSNDPASSSNKQNPTQEKQEESYAQAETKNNPQEKTMKSAQQHMSATNDQDDDMEKRMLGQILDQLTDQEGKLQKAFIRVNTQGQQPRPGQANW